MAQIIAPESEFPVALLSRLSPVSNKVSQFSRLRLEFLGNLRLHHSYGKTPQEKKYIYIYVYIDVKICDIHLCSFHWCPLFKQCRKMKKFELTIFSLFYLIRSQFIAVST